jgi:hypothetical protein
MSNVPAWTLVGPEEFPRSIEVKDRRIHQRGNTRSCAYDNSSDNGSAGAPVSGEAADRYFTMNIANQTKNLPKSHYGSKERS